MKSIFSACLAAVLVIGPSNPAAAGPVDIPNSFQAGTKALAAEVNENFGAVSSAVNDNDSRIAQLEALVSQLQADLQAATSAITALQTAPVDADTLTGLDADQFLRSDTTDSWSAGAVGGLLRLGAPRDIVELGGVLAFSFTPTTITSSPFTLQDMDKSVNIISCQAPPDCEIILDSPPTPGRVIILVVGAYSFSDVIVRATLTTLLDGNTDAVLRRGSSLTLISDGRVWFELSRSIN